MRASLPELRAAGVRVPASTSNLGAGFDCLGLAVDRWMDVSYTPGGDPLSAERPNGDAPPAGRDLVMESFRRALTHGTDGEAELPITGTLHVRSAIPIGFGLGSSAAAVVAGAALARLARGEPVDPAAAFSLAVAEEGHADNAGAAAYGGLVAVVPISSAHRVVPLELSSGLGFAFAAPPSPLSTREARAALPTLLTHSAAVGAVGRMAALIRGLATADADLLRLGFDDVALHAPWRIELIPGAAEALHAAVGAGAWGATISGAGSGLIAVGPRDAAEGVAEAMKRALATHHGEEGTVGYRVTPVLEGVRPT